MDDFNAEEALYRLEERVYGDVVTAIRVSGATDVQISAWISRAMDVLCRAQNAELVHPGDLRPFEDELDALVAETRTPR